MKLKKIRQSIRLFFRPYMIVNTVFLLVYTFIVWYFYIGNGRIHQNNDSRIFYLVPGLISLTLMFIFVFPGLRFAIFKGSSFFASIMLTICLAATTTVQSLMINNYLVSAGTPMVQLEDLSDFSDKPLSRFYKIRHLALDHVKQKHIWGVIGKKSNSVYLEMIVACADTSGSNYNFWILEKRDSFLGRKLLSEQAYDRVLSDLNHYSDTVKYGNIAYFERTIDTETDEETVRMIDRARNNDAKPNIVFEPRFEPLAKRIEDDRDFALLTYFGGNLIWLLLFASSRVSTLKLYDHERKKQQGL